MKSSQTARGDSKVPGISSTCTLPPPVVIPVGDPEGCTVFSSGVVPEDKDRTMKFLKYLSHAKVNDDIRFTRADVGATVKVLLALLDDTERLGNLVLWHMDLAEEGINLVEMLLADATGENRAIAQRWYEVTKNEEPPSELCAPTT